MPAAALALIPRVAEGIRAAGLDLLVIAAPKDDLDPAAERLLKGRRVDLIVSLDVGADAGPLTQASDEVEGAESDGPFDGRLIKTILKRAKQSDDQGPINVRVSGGQNQQL
ncbi:hypothetical protein ACFSM5_06235 [Lacibacterium aquatile]|uniref:Uncharacterized protein n=1 Tax=Lacibacterium aquatile TaxID=1168082 RepID=A0ABW5DT69_9PROT